MTKKNNYSQGNYVKQQVVKQFQQVKYCIFCGAPVIVCSTDEKGYNNIDVNWEQQNSAHYSCYLSRVRMGQ